MFLSPVKKEPLIRATKMKMAMVKPLRLRTAYEDPLTEVNLLFYTSFLRLLRQYNLFLQRGDPLAHKVYPMTKELI